MACVLKSETSTFQGTRSCAWLVLAAGLSVGTVFPALGARQTPPEWTQAHVQISPSNRAVHAMSYDSRRGKTVLFGGITDSQMIDGETWEWNGSTWTHREVVGPNRRYFHTMAFDSARGVTVLFGGDDNVSHTFEGDTWEWDGITWTNRNVAGPGPRVMHAMAYDQARGVTVLFGGIGGENETWEWNGISWTQRFVAGPSSRTGHAMVYDAARGVTMLFGGGTSFGENGETWIWNGTAWTQQFVSGPAPRYFHTMSYDPDRAVTVLYGGYTGTNQAGTDPNSNETWEWDGTSWTQLASFGPPAQASPAMAHSSIPGTTVLFGSAGTWTLGVSCSAPAISTQPTGGSWYVGEHVTLTTSHASGFEPTFRWNKDGVELDESETQSGTRTSELTILAAAAAQSGAYTAALTNLCNTILSDPAFVEIRCIGDFDQDGGVDAADVSAFFTAWESGIETADVNGDGGMDGSDIETFYQHWETGGC